MSKKIKGGVPQHGIFSLGNLLKEDIQEININELANDIVHVVQNAKCLPVTYINGVGEEVYTEEAQKKFEFYKNVLKAKAK